MGGSSNKGVNEDDLEGFLCTRWRAEELVNTT
jgi:hypothetical protein